jgi:integrase
MEKEIQKETSRVKLTKRLIDAVDPPDNGGQIFLRDSALQGFGLRITRGAKTFILEKRIHGRSRRITLGSYGPMTVDAAREKAEKMIGQIAEGKDPADEQLERKREPNFEDLIKMYRERNLTRKKSAHNDELMIDSYLAAWKNRRLSSISRKDVSILHMETGEKHGHYAANRLIALLRKMFNLAQIWGIYEGENPATRIQMFPEKKRERFVHPDELPRLIEALKGEENIYIRAAFLVCLFTGARRGEVLGARWEDIDLNAGVWRMPETKAGRSHLVPLPEPVRELIRSLPVLADNPFVFPGRRPNSHLACVSKAWVRIRNRAKLSDVRIHDLRRTVGSWLAGSGASLPLIGKVLNHSQPSTTAIYARLDIEPVRAALEANAQRMLLVAAKAEKEGEKEKPTRDQGDSPPAPGQNQAAG